MTETREFHIGTVLSAMTGRLMSPQGIDGVYDICQYLTGEKGLMIHQLPRILDEVEPYLRKTFPELADVDIPALGLDTWDRMFGWMDLNLYDRFGEMLTLSPMAPEDHTHIHPLNELMMKMPNAQLFVIGVEEEFDDDRE